MCLLFSCPDKVIFLSSARPTDYLKVVCFASLRAGFFFSPTSNTNHYISIILVSSVFRVFSCCPLTRCPGAIRPLIVDWILPACVSLPAPVSMLIVCLRAPLSASVTEAPSPHKLFFTGCHLISLSTYTHNKHTTSGPCRSQTAS